MAASRASQPPSPDSHSDRTEIRRRDGSTDGSTDSLPATLPKSPRALSFESADRSSVRRLSQLAPMPSREDEAFEDSEEEIDTLLFRRDQPSLPSLEALKVELTATRVGRRVDPAGPPVASPAPSSRQRRSVPPPPPTPRFAPPLPIPPREAIEHPSDTAARRVAPPPADFTKPRTLRAATLPTRRRIPWGGLAVLALAALVGAIIGWLATPYVHGEPAGPSNAAIAP